MRNLNLLKKFSALALGSFMMLSSAASAQTIVWGTGHSDLRIDSIGSFTSSDGTFASLGWSAVSRGNPTVLWTWANNPTVSTAYVPSFPISGNTPSTGYAFFDGDGYDAAGIAGPHDSYIESPSFDLSGYTDSLLAVRLYTGYRVFNTTEYSVSFSSDGGTTWSAPFSIFQATGVAGTHDYYDNYVNVPMPGVTAGVADLSDCKLRFTLKGETYFKVIDDVSVITLEPYFDLAIGGVGDGPYVGDAFSSIKVSNNYYTPLSQVDPNEFFFGARITNKGLFDITITDNLKLNVRIEQEDNTQNYTTVHTQSIDVEELLVGETIADDPVIDMLNWYPTEEGKYRVVYFLTSDHPSVDINPANDSLVQFFEISNDYFSKVPLDIDGVPDANRTALPATDPGETLTSFEYGSMFTIPNGRRDSLSIEEVNYIFVIPNGIDASMTEVTPDIRIYKYVDDGDGALNDNVPSTELSLVGIGIDSIPIAGNKGIPLARTVRIGNIDDGGAVTLDDNSIYFVTVNQDRSLGMIIGNTYYCGAVGMLNGEEDYTMNIMVSDAHASPIRIGSSITSGGATTTQNEWSWPGFGGDALPSIGFHIKKIIGTKTELVEATKSMSIFPNPNKGVLNLNVDLGENTNTVVYTINDASGRIVHSVVRHNIEAETYTFNIENLPAGVYFLNVLSDKGSSTQSFIKQ